MDKLTTKTIDDFGDQWSKYVKNEGWYGSLALFKDMISPLLSTAEIEDKVVVDIGSGTGRIVNMLLQAGVQRVYAVEPAVKACQSLQKNITTMEHADAVTVINKRGDNWHVEPPIDFVFSIGVIHHIPEPRPVLDNVFSQLKPGGVVFLWLYGYEGNEFYLRIFQPLRAITKRMPHFFLRGIVEVLYFFLYIYRFIGRLFPVPLKPYIDKVLWPMSPANRRLVIYDQLNPAYAKYYKKQEAIELLEKSGFQNIQLHHRHGYSWSVMGHKPK